MRVLPIDPPANRFTGLVKRGYPAGLCLLAAVAREAGAREARVLDMDRQGGRLDGLEFLDQRANWQRFLDAVNDPGNCAWRQLGDFLCEYKPHVVGITSMTIHFASALKVAEVVKRWDDDCLVVIGGPQASAMPGNAVEWPWIDLAVNGEGEEPFREVLTRRFADRSDFGGIKGVLTTKDDRATYQEVGDLDVLPQVRRSVLTTTAAYGREDLGLMMTSRGCPYRMMALPMEREEQIYRTLEFMKELDPAYASIGTYKPYPGTSLFQEAVALGLVHPAVDNAHFLERNPVDYFFVDPHRRCVHIPAARLHQITTHVAREFERHNRRIRNVARRVNARRRLYLRDRRCLWTDLRRAKRWLAPA